MAHQLRRVQGRREGVSYARTPDGRVIDETETYGCGHCQHVTEMGPGQSLDDLGKMCLVCMRPLCKVCTHRAQTGGGCDPFEKKLLRIEQAAISRRSYEECSR